MKARTTLNKPLLRKLAAKLRRLRHEEHYNQHLIAAKTACGTAACVAGWALILSGEVNPKSKTFECEIAGAASLQKAGEILGLKRSLPADDGHYHWLFATTPDAYGIPARWPEEFAKRWTLAAQFGNERPSRIAADLLDAIADGTVKL